MLFNLLSDVSTSSGTGSGGKSNYGGFLIMGVLFLLIILFMVFNRRTQKKKQQEALKMLDSIQPGNKVKTIGGICGIVVEVCPEDNTFVLETGTEASGKCYLKFDKQAVYQTDAGATPVEETTTEVAEEKTETVEEVVEAPVETTEVVEEKTEE